MNAGEEGRRAVEGRGKEGMKKSDRGDAFNRRMAVKKEKKKQAYLVEVRSRGGKRRHLYRVLLLIFPADRERKSNLIKRGGDAGERWACVLKRKGEEG